MKRGAKASCDSLNCVVTHRGAVECKDTQRRTVPANPNIPCKTGDDLLECCVCGRTDLDCRLRKLRGMWLCPRHVTQMYRHGEFNDNTIYQPNEILLFQDHGEIILKDKNGEETGRAIIDLDDVDRCRQYKWHLKRTNGRTNYVIASLPNNQKVHLHRFILGYDGDLDVDHINLNGLDNRKSNLRVVTHQRNTTNNHGVGVNKVGSGRYQAIIGRNYKQIYLGTFDTFEEAADARRRFIETHDD